MTFTLFVYNGQISNCAKASNFELRRGILILIGSFRIILRQVLSNSEHRGISNSDTFYNLDSNRLRQNSLTQKLWLTLKAFEFQLQRAVKMLLT